MSKVLIVEDDKVLSKMYGTKFSNSGYKVEVAGDGEEGLEKMKNFGPDIVLMDLMMPKMDGFQALQLAKADKDLKTIPIIVISNLSAEVDSKDVIGKGAAGFIIKSNLTPSEMVEKVEEIIKKVQ